MILMKILGFAVLCLFLSLPAIAKPESAVTDEKKPVAASYKCRRVVGDILIDGRLDERAWRNADKIDFLVPVTS